MKSYCKGLRIDRELVAQAYTNWESGSAGKKNKWRVKRDYGTADNLIDEITREIAGRRINTTPIRYRTRYEPTNGKERVTGIESVKQQVLNYVAVLCISGFANARLGYYQAASVQGKGQDFLRRAIRRDLPKCRYWIKTDIRKCYQSINPERVSRMYHKYIRSADVLYLIDYLLSTYDNGLNIGSYFATVTANIVMSFAYHHMESLGKRRRGEWKSLVVHQYWFMDDALFLGNDKRDLKRAVNSMCAYLESEWGLTVKPWKLSRVGEPFTMCGYTFRPHRTTVAAVIFIRARRACRRFLSKPILRLARRIISYHGRIKHADCHGFEVRSGYLKAKKVAVRLISEHDRKEANEARTRQCSA